MGKPKPRRNLRVAGMNLRDLNDGFLQPKKRNVARIQKPIGGFGSFYSDFVVSDTGLDLSITSMIFNDPKGVAEGLLRPRTNSLTLSGTRGDGNELTPVLDSNVPATQYEYFGANDNQQAGEASEGTAATFIENAASALLFLRVKATFWHGSTYTSEFYDPAADALTPLALDIDLRPSGFSGNDTEWIGPLGSAVQVASNPMPDENAGWLQFTETDSERLQMAIPAMTVLSCFMTFKPDTAVNFSYLIRFGSSSRYLRLDSAGRLEISGVDTLYIPSNGTEYIIIVNDDNGGGALEWYIYDNTGTLLDSSTAETGTSGTTSTLATLGSSQSGGQLLDGQMNYIGIKDGGNFDAANRTTIVDFLVANM